MTLNSWFVWLHSQVLGSQWSIGMPPLKLMSRPIWISKLLTRVCIYYCLRVSFRGSRVGLWDPGEGFVLVHRNGTQSMDAFFSYRNGFTIWRAWLSLLFRFSTMSWSSMWLNQRQLSSLPGTQNHRSKWTLQCWEMDHNNSLQGKCQAVSLPPPASLYKSVGFKMVWPFSMVTHLIPV